ncbi:MAG: hypothetical protein IS632_09120 [Thaumarchaeota archaeon]|nr:hypothetical protein [Nitrososphaerota archaeon]
MDGVVAAPLIAGKIEAGLHSDGDTTFAIHSTQNPATGSLTTRVILFQMHDGCIFAAEQPFVTYTR